MELLPSYLTGIIAVLLLTCFVKVFTTLSILRYGLGLAGGSFGIVILAISLALSLFIMEPLFHKSGGSASLLQSAGFGANLSVERFRPFMEAQTDPQTKARFGALAEKLNKAEAAPAPEGGAADAAAETKAGSDLPVLIISFLISELKDAFQAGVLILIPFLVIDLLVAHVLLSVGITQISQMVVSLPIKLLLFLAVDGWALITEKLIVTYVSQS